MNKLSGVRLSTTDPAALAEFYTSHLGMSAHPDGSDIRLGYGGQGADIVLSPNGEAYTPARSGRYWKIGITLPNVDIAHTQLTNAGISVNAPRQFGKIGYMCHLSDPAGFQIELLQHDFQPNRPDNAGDPNAPLGGGAQMGQITLRCTAIEPALTLYKSLGMTLLSVQPLPDYGFDLYFFAFTDEIPPNSDLKSIGNREWLWKRPYTTLELQHLHAGEITRNSAYMGLEVTELEKSLNDDFGDPLHIR